MHLKCQEDGRYMIPRLKNFCSAEFPWRKKNPMMLDPEKVLRYSFAHRGKG